MSITAKYPAQSIGGVPVYVSLASFPATAANGALGVAGDTHILYEYNTTSIAWEPIASYTAYQDALASVGAATSIGAIDSQAKSANALVLAANALYAQTADATHPGMVSTGAQTLAGAKTLTSAPILSSLTASLPLQLDASKNVTSSAIDLSTSQVTGILPVAKGGASPLGYVYYVDNGRTDTYTPDGSQTKPFLTIQAAVNAGAATGPGASVSIIVSGGTYTENVTLNSSNIVQLSLLALTLTTITPASGYALASTSNNTQLDYLTIDGFAFYGGVNFVGDTNNTGFAGTGLFLNNSVIFGNSVFTNLGQPTLYNTEVQGNIPFNNVNGATVRDGRVINGVISVVSDYLSNGPSGFSGTSLYLENALAIGANLTIDSTSYVQFRRGTRFGASGGTLTVQSGGELETYDSFIRSNIVINSGGTYINHSGFHQGTLTNSGTYTNQQTADQISYTPTTPGNWATVPTNVLGALDTVVQNFVGDSGSGGVKGLVPAPASGDAAASKFLKADGTWAATGAGGGGTVTSASVVSANGFAGTVATATTTPAITLTTTINGILQGNGSAISAAATTGSGSLVLATAPTMSNPVVGTQAQSDNSTKAASTAYVTTAINNAVSGVNPAVAVQAATTLASNTSNFTYANGVSGVGATLTSNTTNTAFTVDGYTFTAVNQRVLVKNDTQSPSGAFNGVYFVSQVQALGLPVILTRALDYDQPSDINNTGAIPVVNGTLNGTTSWVETAQIATVGTDPLVFTKFTRNPADYLLVSNNLSDVASKPTSFNNVSPVTTTGDLIYGSGANTNSRLGIGSTGQVLTVAGGIPSWAPASGSSTAYAPAVQTITTAGSGTFNAAYVFAISSGNATVGATYTNNSVTFTVLETVASGTVIHMSGSSTPLASGTLTKTSGTGDSTLTFSAYKAPLYWGVLMLGAGGGGGAGSPGNNDATNGGDTTFGSGLTAPGGTGGLSYVSGPSSGASGNAPSNISGGRILFAVAGGAGGSSGAVSGSPGNPGGRGGVSYLAGSAAEGVSSGGSIDPALNSGSGGAGGASTNNYAGTGGAAGAVISALVYNPPATISYTVGAKGTKGTGGTRAGTDGADGYIAVTSYYQ